MAKKLLRLTESLYNTPHLVHPSTFETVLKYLELRNAGLMKMDEGYPEGPDDNEPVDPFEGVGVIEIHGALTYKPVYGMCGEVAGCSYEGLLEQFEYYAEMGVHTIITDIASGGGAGTHAFEYVNEARSICDEYGIQWIAYVDECAYSAAYAWACAADEVIINPSAGAGSIGVLIALMDSSKAMDMAGLKMIFITAGAEKVPFDEEGSFKQEFLDELQTCVDKLNLEFVSHVSKYTGLSAETVIGFQAKTFDAEESLSNGLVNQIMTKKEFAAYIADKQKQTGVM